MHRQGILMYPVYYERKALKKPISNIMTVLGDSQYLLYIVCLQLSFCLKEVTAVSQARSVKGLWEGLIVSSSMVRQYLHQDQEVS